MIRKFLRSAIAHWKLGVRLWPGLVGAWRFARTGYSGPMRMRPWEPPRGRR